MPNFHPLILQTAGIHGWELLPDNPQWTHRIAIYGASGNRYIVAQHKQNKSWSCGCLGFRRHRHCKHLSAMRDTLMLMDAEQPIRR